MHKVVSAIDGTLHEIQIPSNEPQHQFDSGHRKYHCIHKNIIVKTSKGRPFILKGRLCFLPCSQKMIFLWVKILHQNNFSLQFACKNSFFLEHSASRYFLGKKQTSEVELSSSLAKSRTEYYI